jgi:hypothetical protein
VKEKGKGGWREGRTSNDEKSRVGELGSDRGGDELVCLVVGRSGCFVKEEEAGAPKECASHAEELTLSGGEVGSLFRVSVSVVSGEEKEGKRSTHSLSNLSVEVEENTPVRRRVLSVPLLALLDEVNTAKSVEDLVIIVSAEHVQRRAESAREDDLVVENKVSDRRKGREGEERTNRVLRDDGQLRPEIVETDVGDVEAVDEDRTRCRLDKSEKGRGEGRFAATGSADDSDLLTRLDRERQVVQHSGSRGCEPRSRLEASEQADGARRFPPLLALPLRAL